MNYIHRNTLNLRHRNFLIDVLFAQGSIVADISSVERKYASHLNTPSSQLHMMKAPTLFFCVLATLSSVVYAVPAQRRQVNELQDCQAKLDKDITTFNNIASTITSPILEIDLEVQFVSY